MVLFVLSIPSGRSTGEVPSYVPPSTLNVDTGKKREANSKHLVPIINHIGPPRAEMILQQAHGARQEKTCPAFPTSLDRSSTSIKKKQNTHRIITHISSNSFQTCPAYGGTHNIIHLTPREDLVQTPEAISTEVSTSIKPDLPSSIPQSNLSSVSWITMAFQGALQYFVQYSI